MLGQAWNQGVTEVYPEELADLDRTFRYIVDKGLVHATALGCHAQALDFRAPGAARLARYWVARSGASPVIWFTAQEFDANALAYEPVWKEAAKAIAASDGCHHPMTGHDYSTAAGRNVTTWKVLGCWLGKNIGGTLGAPFEWRRQVNDVSFYTQAPRIKPDFRE